MLYSRKPNGWFLLLGNIVANRKEINTFQMTEYGQLGFLKSMAGTKIPEPIQTPSLLHTQSIVNQRVALFIASVPISILSLVH